jgi:hypothetical protein
MRKYAMEVPKHCARPQLAKIGIALMCILLVLQYYQCGAEWHPERVRLLRTPELAMPGRL